GARSGKAGVFGALSLIMVVLLLFKSIEDAFNEIWGVRIGRTWLTRIVVYWSIFTLGAVLFLASITGVGAGSLFAETSILSFLVPLLSTVLLVALLTLFYRAIPNTKVLWRAALAGGFVA